MHIPRCQRCPFIPFFTWWFLIELWNHHQWKIISITPKTHPCAHILLIPIPSIPLAPGCQQGTSVSQRCASSGNFLLIASKAANSTWDTDVTHTPDEGAQHQLESCQRDQPWVRSGLCIHLPVCRNTEDPIETAAWLCSQQDPDLGKLYMSNVLIPSIENLEERDGIEACRLRRY